MNRTLSARILAILLALLMVIGTIPMTAGATETDSTVPAEDTVPAETVVETTVPEETIPETTAPETLESVVSQNDFSIPEGVQLMTINGFVSETHDVSSHAESTIAPGVTQYINYAYAKDGKQMVYYVLVADVTRDDVVVQTSYKDQYVNGEFGMEKLTVQMAYADQLYTDETSDRYISEYYKAVGGVNASFYNMTTGQPSGVTYLDGVQIGESSSYAQFFAILKDGTAIIDYTANLANYEGNIWQAVAGSQMLVWNGADVTATVSGSYNTDRHSRTCVGVTADGKVVMMTLDGRQEPFSCGGTMHELAQIMLEAGCIAAINLDGGGSATFAARQEGENEVTIVNRPSDGSERSISSGLIIGSLTVPSDVFDRATLTAENEYVTPGSAVAVTAKGVSPAGTAAEIPENVTWQLADSTMGSVENGVFTSNGTAGDAVVQMVYEGNVVGETTIHVVIPDAIAFASSTITIPYSKTVALEVVASYGLNEVALKVSDLVFTLSDTAMGTISGNNMTATSDQTVAGGTVTVSLVHNTALTADANIVFGRASEVVYDFETGDDSIANITYGFKGTTYPEDYGFYDVIDVVSAEDGGKVKNGAYSLRISSDCDSITMMGWCQTRFNGWNIDLTGATSLSFWMYIPEGSYGCEWDLMNAIPIGLGHEFVYGTGWQYITVPVSELGTDVTNLDRFTLYHSDTDNDDYGYQALNNPNYYTEVVYYIDDITVNYSSAVDDFIAPEISDVLLYCDNVADTSVQLNGQTITSNVVNITAKAADDAGVDAGSVKVYVDGNAVAAVCDERGFISVDSLSLANGTHTFRIEISDKNGNVSYVDKSIVIAAAESADNTIKYAPADATLTDLPVSSIYWMNLTATAVEKVDTIEIKVDLDNNSDWELDHMELAEGFEAAYTIDAETNDATIIIVRTEDVAAVGEAVVASLPIRVWTPEFAKINEDAYSYRLVAVQTHIEMGKLSETDGNKVFFSSEKTSTVTEYNNTRQNTNSTKTSWHIHTAAATNDNAATCTTDGYTGRTYCDICASVVDWGTTIPATGHTYEETDGVLKCGCGDLFQGEKDGKLYVDGVAANGWIDDSYYAEGVKLTGIQLIDGYYYDLGEDGVCAGQAKYTGLIQQENGLSYAKFGELVTGWVLADEKDYYFGEDFLAVGGTDVRINGYIYSFDENYVLIKGMWTKDSEGRVRYVWADKAVNNQFREIEGNLYVFNASGYLLMGDQYVRFTHGDPYTMYYITDEGLVLGEMGGYTGLHKSSAGVFMVVDGEATYAGLVQDAEGNYYYINSSRKAVTNTAYSIGAAKTNGLLPAGTYTFDEEGKMIDPPVAEEPDEPETEVKQGLVWDEDGEIRYYVDGVATYAGLVQDSEGNYYYINSSKKAVKNTRYGIGEAKTNGLLPAGVYEFGEDGKMINPPTVDPEEPETEGKQGLVWDEDGEIRYYVDGVATYAGLVQDSEGNYYYINSYKKAVKNCTYGIGAAKTNGLLPAGVYEFGEDGKMIDPPTVDPEEPESEGKQGLVWDEDGEIRYYVDGVATYAGLVQDSEGNYYYINSYKKAVKNCTYGIGAAKTNGLLPAGRYTFGADGKMIDPPVA